MAYIVKLTDPGDVYGPYAMGTSAFSNTYYSFDGGPGQVGIHGTNQPWVIGSYASHGCVRLPNAPSRRWRSRWSRARRSRSSTEPCCPDESWMTLDVAGSHR